MSTSEVATVAPPPEAPHDELRWWARCSDRINPILVREIQQAMKGRAFVFTVFAALAVSIVIAVVVAGNYPASQRAGAEAFAAGLATLVPLVIFVVPMQAYQSMRLELRAGIVEQLFLTGLRPRSILLGKLMAAMVQFGLYVSVMAPLLATSYLLRGVDVPTIAVSIVWALVFCITATTFAISSAAQAILPAMQALANLGVASGLGLSTFGLVVFIGGGEYARDLQWLLGSSEFALVMSLIVVGGLCSTVLSLLTAQCFLLHSFENRSTGFRLFLFAMMPVTFGWMLLFIDSSHWSDALPAVTVFLCLLGTVFGIFMTTEQFALSPRVFAHVPASPLLAALATPLLPGRDRGMCCLVVYFGLLGLAALWFWPLPGTTRFMDYREGVARFCVFTAAYTLVYLTLTKALRERLPASVAGNHVARFLVVLMLFAFCLLPVLVDVFARGEVDDWHWGHVMNPFWTIAQFALRNHAEAPRAMQLALLALGAATALQVPAMLRGTREVLLASSARRQHEAATAVHSADT